MSGRSKLDINTATVDDFAGLVGVGRAKAEAIVEARKNVGSYSSVSDMMKVPGIGPGVLEQNLGRLVCYNDSKSPKKGESSRGTRNSSRIEEDEESDASEENDDKKLSGAAASAAHYDAKTCGKLSSTECDKNKTETEQKVQCEGSHSSKINCGALSHLESENAQPSPGGHSVIDSCSEDDCDRGADRESGDEESCSQWNSESEHDASPSPLVIKSKLLDAGDGLIEKNLMKRKPDFGPDSRGLSPGKKPRSCDGGLLSGTATSHIFGTIPTSSNSMAADTMRKRIPSRSNPPPELADWLKTFETWSNAERLLAIDQVIELCEPTQVRHMMAVIEPQFQRDFISLLPKELALYVLSFLDPKDLLQAAQTCRYWRILAEDNLLWREKCREGNIDEATVFENRRRRRSSSAIPKSPWKGLYMRQHQIEQNWRFGKIREPKVLKGHDDHVITCLEFCNTRIVSGSDDNTLKVWSAVTGKCLRTLVGHTGGVWSSQMSDNIIISGSTDRTLKVWNADTGQCIHTLYGHTSTVRCMHLHGDRVVSGSRDATLRLWNIDNGQCLHVLMGHMAAVRCVQYDGRRVVSGAYDYTVKVWDPDTETCLHTLEGHTNRVYSLQFDGVHIVSGSLDTSICVWDVETGNCLHTLIGHQSLTSGMELKDNILVSGNADSTVKVWDITTGQCLQTLQGPNKHQSAVTCLQFNKKFVITSSDDGTVKIWDLRTGDFIRNLVALDSGGSGGVVWRVRTSNTKLVCAVGSRNGTEETKLMVLDFDVEEK